MSTAARKRLMRDFKRLQHDPPTGVQGSPLDNNVMIWQAVIFGWERIHLNLNGTVLEDFNYLICIHFLYSTMLSKWYFQELSWREDTLCIFSKTQMYSFQNILIVDININIQFLSNLVYFSHFLTICIILFQELLFILIINIFPNGSFLSFK